MPDTNSPPTHFTRGHRWLTTVNLLIATAAVVAVLAMVNYLAEGHFKRFLWANRTNLKLSPQTIRVLRSLTNDVDITIFFARSHEDDIYTMVAGLLGEYQNINPGRIHVKELDYERYPIEGRELLDKHHLTGPKDRDFILFEANKHDKVCYAQELSDYDVKDILAGRSRIARRTAFRGEMLFTSDIFAVSYAADLKAYFLTGHGERSPVDPSGQGAKPPENGYSKLAGILKNEINCNWQTLTLLGTNGVPSDCNLLIIATSYEEKSQLNSDELAQIETYLEHDGRMLALLDTTEGLDEVLGKWGVALAPVRVIDADPNVRIGNGGAFLAQPAGDLAHGLIHPIMKPLINEQLMVEMFAPRPILLSRSASSLGGATITPLAATSTNGVEVTVTNAPPRTFVLLAAIEKGVITGHDGTRIVLAGDASFLDDQLIDTSAANHYFAEKAMDWLLRRPDLSLVGLGPSPIEEYKLSLTKTQTMQARWLFLGGMPGSILFLGALVWLRRRS